jgi:hypothetical protein
MSERLVFELLAVDRATAPLKAVQTQLDNTTAATRKLGNQTAGTTKEFRKFALGGLQQAGFQIGDFFVQVANGTNKMQAFGQQAPQFLQIFGPIGSVVGAAIAVFAAFSVIAEKSASAVKDSVGTYAESLDRLSAAIQNAKDAIDQFRFGDSVASFTENEIKNLESQVQRLRQLLTELRTTETSGSSTGLQQIAAMFSRDAAIEEFQTRREELRVLEDKLQVFRALEEAQRMLNGGLSVSSGIQKGLVYDKEVELRNARELVQSYVSQIEVMGRTKAEAEAIAEAASKAGVSANDLAHINFSNIATAATEALRLAGNLGISLDAAARLAALGPQGIGGNDPSGGTYGGRGAGPSQADIIAMRVAGQFGYNTPPDNKKGGGGATDPIKRLREQLALEAELLGKTEAQQRVIQALGLDYQKYGDTALNSLVGQITEMDRLNKLAEQQKEIASTIRSAFSGAFMSMVDGTKSVKDAFRDMARSIIMKLYEVLVVQRIVNGIMGFVGKAFPSLAPFLDTAWNGGGVTGNKPVLVGEKGPEIIVPSRNSQVVANHQMGGGGVSVVQNISFGAGVTRAEIQAMLPKIVESTKAAVFDAQRRSVNGMGYA